MNGKLPIRLKREPLLDAVFECRFESLSPASNVLPGYLVSKLNGIGSIENMPAMDLPLAVRNTDPNLFYSPLISLSWGKFKILVSDRSFVVSCAMPYPGWVEFRASILEVLSAVAQLEIVSKVQRYSMKYTDLIPASTTEDQAAIVDLKLNIGMHSFEGEGFDIRTELDRDGFRHILRIVSGASIGLSDGTSRVGLVIETDTLRVMSHEKFSVWAKGVSPDLESMHIANKAVFFGCLSEEGLNLVEPEYD